MVYLQQHGNNKDTILSFTKQAILFLFTQLNIRL